MIKKSFNSLAGKLIIAVGALMTVGSLLFGYIFVSYEEKIMLNNLISYASSKAELIKRGVFYGMLTAHGDIEQTINVVGAGPDILGIAIYNKAGKIIYSSDKSSVGQIIGKDAISCQICHAYSNPSEVVMRSQNWKITKDKNGRRSLKFVIPLYNEPSCYTAACHRHQKDQKVLGVIETDFSTATVDKTIRQNRIGTILFGGLFVSIISVTLCIILYNFVSKPISLLEEGMKRIAQGDLDYEIKINTSDEMGLLARTFNNMTKDIKRYKENMENWTKALEEEIQKKTAEIMKAHEQLINAEKLASLGRMAAGVAHELNSPLTGIVTFAHLMLKRLPPENKQDREDLEIIIEQANRCSKIIKGLLGFSRKATAERVEININTLLDSTIAMVRNQAKFHNIKFVLNFDESLPMIHVDPNQMQQVFLNLLINAADAMNERGQITIATRTVGESEETPWFKMGHPHEGKKYIEIEFTDTGPGIPEEYMGKIFEPFFTTKPVGKGTGLGLAVSYGIIKRHGGNITVRSEPGKGASFFIRLPVEEGSEIG